MGMAEALGWEPKAFQEAFREVFREGMAKASWDDRVVLIPKAILHNLPQSPNVVRSWSEEWKLIAECDLKNEARQIIREALSTVGASYVAVFDEITNFKPSPKPSPKPSRKASSNPSLKASTKPMANQEQYQQQQKNNKKPPLPPQGGETDFQPSLGQTLELTAATPAPDQPSTAAAASVPTAFEQAKALYPKRDGGQNWQQAQRAWTARLREGIAVETLLEGTRAYAGYIRRLGKEGTPYVKQAATFYGPDRHFAADWGPPLVTEAVAACGGRRIIR
jgi:hypothetical protein